MTKTEATAKKTSFLERWSMIAEMFDRTETDDVWDHIRRQRKEIDEIKARIRELDNSSMSNNVAGIKSV